MRAEESIARIKYLTCGKELHEGESLNLVCVQQKCTNSGLICSLCREKHEGHRIIPLKVVLANLKDKMNSPLESDQYCDKLEELENVKQAMLFELKCCVEQAAEQFRLLQQDIIDTYNKIKVEIIEQIQLSMQINDLLVSALHGPINQEYYLLNFQKLSKWVNEKEEELSFNLNLDQYTEPFHVKHQVLTKQLANITTFIEKQLTSFKEKDYAAEVELEKPVVISNVKYRFSTTLKGSSITINDDRKVAKQSFTNASRFALIEELTGIKERTIIFKITNLANWIGLGVCLKDRILAVNYAFKYEQLGHGSYLLSNNGYTWSHSSTEDNIHPCLFTFKLGNTIEVSLSPSQLTFKVRETNAIFKLKINYKEQQWPNVCFCVNLCSQNDSAQILDE